MKSSGKSEPAGANLCWAPGQIDDRELWNDSTPGVLSSSVCGDDVHLHFR